MGSSGVTKYVLQAPDKPVLIKEAKVEFVDDGPGKAEGINRFIGRRPIFAFGNSDGDQQMLEWTAAGAGARFMGLRAPHRRRARIRLRSQLADRPPRQGVGRGDAAQVDRRRHEERLESDLSVRDEVMDTLEKQAAATADMIRIPGGTFRMGSDRHYPGAGSTGSPLWWRRPATRTSRPSC